MLDFVGGEKLAGLAALGTSCPDHFLRTKIWPLVLPFDPARDSVEQLVARIKPAIEAYRERYAGYYDRCKRPGSPKMRDANPVVYLVPGVGMITFAADKATARIAGEFYVNAINVMRGAASVSNYRGLPEQEAFDIEYWDLEEAKLQRMPKPKALAGRVALITGGAGGIGLATARRLMDEGACVVICDIDREALAGAEAELKKKYGADVVASSWVDVTREDAVIAGFRDSAWKFGGVDICISNAGIASASPVEETTLALWQKNMDILSTGYFLIARQAFLLFKSQGIGGSIVFIGSKNALAASPGAAAYCTAKAAELHLARCLALEGAPFRHSRECREPGRRAARVAHLAGRMGAAACRPIQEERRRTRVGISRAQPAQAQRVPGRRGRSRGILRLRAFRQVDGQYRERRRRQCRRVYALTISRGIYELRRSA